MCIYHTKKKYQRKTCGQEFVRILRFFLHFFVRGRAMCYNARMTQLEKYYAKFKEDRRLSSRHGIVEFTVSMYFIHKYIEEFVRAGTDSAREKIGAAVPRDSGAVPMPGDSLDFQNCAESSGVPDGAGILRDSARVLEASQVPADFSGSRNNAGCVASSPDSGVSPARQVRILDVGAGTGRYSVALAREGHDVTAVELVRHNLDILLAKHEKVKCWPGDARDLHFLPAGAFDITLLFGPLYHLHTARDRLMALREAKRVTRAGGVILAAYVMNEYSVLTYCFRQGHIAECLANGTLSADFHALTEDGRDLYSYVRLEDINALDEAAGLAREDIFAPDGAADYLRRELNALDEESFQAFIRYQLATCRRPELLGASSHIVDVLRVRGDR